jgi:hypothetical protein
MRDDDQFVSDLGDALALVAAYHREDNDAVLDLLGMLRTRHDVLRRYTVLAELMATLTDRFGSEAGLQEALLGLQIDPTGEKG